MQGISGPWECRKPQSWRSSPAPTRSASGTICTRRRSSEVHAAIVAAVRSGRLAEERLAEAAERVAAVCRWASPTDVGAAGR